MTPEDMRRARDAIRATELDCASWPDDALDEIIAAVLVGSQPAEPVDDQFKGWDEITEAEKLDIAEARAKVAKLRPPPAPGLSAVNIARAFEVMLPEHALALSVRHNPHKWDGVETETIEEHMASYDDAIPWVSPVEQQKALTTDELWILSWYDGGGVAIAAASLPVLAQWLQDNGLAFGS